MGSGRLLCSGDCKKWQVLEEGVIDFGLRYTLLCALLPDGLTRCWFRGHHGSYPKKHQGRPSTSSLVVGVMDACSTDSSGRYDCVRLDRAGMTPWPQWTDAKYRPPPEPKHDDLIAMDVSFKYACAVRKNGEVWCAGDNYNGQLGSSGGPGQSSSTYLRVPGVTNAVAVAVGTTFTCSLRGSGELVCWGERVWAPGQFRPMVPPSIVSGVGVVTRLAADFGPICALSTDGRITCLGSPWGPKRLIAHDPNFASIAAGGDNVCALTTDGTVHCWSAYGGLPKSCTSGAEPELDAATPGGER